MSIPANSILQLTFLGAYAGNRVVHTRCFKLIEGGAGTETAQQICADFLNKIGPTGANDFITSYLACLTSGYTIQIAQAQIIYPTRYAYVRTTAGLGLPGTRAATSTALLDCVITMQSALSGRTEVSNFKIGPASAVDFTNGTLGADIMGVVDLYRENLLQPVTTTVGLAQFVPGIFHPNFQPGGEDFSRYVTGYVQDTARAKTTRTVRRGE